MHASSTVARSDTARVHHAVDSRASRLSSPDSPGCSLRWVGSQARRCRTLQTWRRRLGAAGLAFALACAPAAATVRTAVAADPSGFRVIVPATGERIPFTRMTELLARSDVIFFGEQHDDRETHRAEVMVLDALGRSRRPVVLSLEMFERDVQPVLDDYLAGRIGEADFLARSRPWPNYVTDYRPLVEMARGKGWPVVASNVPRRIASALSRQGLPALDSLPPADRAHAAREVLCPADAYRSRFMEQMRSHAPGGGPAAAGDTLPTAIAERYYLSQCVRDETMAESIVEARRRAPRNAIIIHINGSFHSDFGQGVPARVARREPGWDSAGITAVPSTDPEGEAIAAHAGRADFIIFTRRP